MFRTVNLKRLLQIFLTITLIGSLAYLLGWSDFLTVKKVNVMGTSSTNLVTSQIRAAGIELRVGQRLARVDTRGIKRTLYLANWLSEAKTNRNWFSREVSISVLERTPVAKFIDASGQIKNFDPQGIQFVPKSADQLAIQNQIPMIGVGNDGANNPAQVQILTKFLGQFPISARDYLKQLSSLGVDSLSNVQMKTTYQNRAIEINWGQVSDLEQKAKVLELLLLQPENQQITSINLSLPDQPTVK